MEETSVPPPTPEAPAGPRRDMLIIIGILVVGCCAIIGLGVSGYFLYQNYQSSSLVAATTQVQATQTAKRTEVASFDFFETFADNTNDWHTGPNDSEFWRGDINVSDGMYVWNVLETKQPFVAWEGYPSQVSYQDFDVTVDARRDQGSEDQACYGLLFRESPTTNGFDDGAYTLSVCDNQQYSVSYFSAATDWETLVDWTDETIIRPGDWNTLGIHARGDKFTFLINSKEVNTVTDSRSPEGYVYVFVDIYDESVTALIRFDNFGISAR